MALPTNPVIILAGQSNTQGSSPSPGGPEGGADFAATTLATDNSIRFVASDNFGEHTSVAGLGMVSWGDTVNNALRAPHFGPEQTCGAVLKAAGWTNITILKWTHNGQAISNFLPGGADHYRLHRVLTLGRPRGATITPFFYFMQGEADALASESSAAQANDWGNRYNTMYAAVTAAVGHTPRGGKIIGRVSSGIYGAGQGVTAPYLSNVRAAQAATANYLINTDGYALYAQDTLHYTGAAMHQHGTDLANVLLSIMAV